MSMAATRPLRRLVLLTALALALVTAGAAKADPAPQGNQTLRAQWIVSGPFSRSGYFAIRGGGVFVYYVRVRNMNFLGWAGSIYVGTTDRNLFLLPGVSTWVDSPAIITPPLSSRLHWSVGVDPISDATSLLVQLWF
jgi:hypothetical protein